MHECPDCGQACDCDDSDIWTDDLPEGGCECHPLDESGWPSSAPDGGLWDVPTEDE